MQKAVVRLFAMFVGGMAMIAKALTETATTGNSHFMVWVMLGLVTLLTAAAAVLVCLGHVDEILVKPQPVPVRSQELGNGT